MSALAAFAILSVIDAERYRDGVEECEQTVPQDDALSTKSQLPGNTGEYDQYGKEHHRINGRK